MSIKVNPFQNTEAFNFLTKEETSSKSVDKNEISITSDAGTSATNNQQSFAREMQKFQLLQKLFSSDIESAKIANNTSIISPVNLTNDDDDEVLRKTQQLIDNYRRQIKPNEVKGARPVEGGNVPGHANPKHNVSKEVQAEVMNKPERIFSGKNDNGRYVDIYYKNESAVITEQGDKSRVITAYGLIDKKAKNPKPFNLEKITGNPNYVEIKLEKLGSTNVIYPNKERFDKNDFPNRSVKPSTPSNTNGSGSTGGNTEVKPNIATPTKPNVSTNTEVPVVPKSPTASEETQTPKPSGRLSGNMIRGLAILQLVQVGLTALNYTKLKEDSDKYGYYIDPFLDKYVISDPEKAAKNLGEGFELTFYVDPQDFYNQGNSIVFTVKDGKFTNPDGWQLVYNKEKGYTEAVLTA